MKRNFASVTYIFALIAITTLSSCKMGRFAYYNFANITDHKIFPARTATNDSVKFHYKTTPNGKAPKSVNYTGTEIAFDDYLAQSQTVAFLIIKNDTIQYEKYFNGYNEESVVASFSMAKSVTSILIGCAIDDGLIKSVDEPIINYIPELKDKDLDNVTIKHLLQMTSGIKFNESYVNPFGDAATFYYGTNLMGAIKRRKPETAPGTQFSYSSGDTQLLGLVLERALKDKPVTQYLQEKLWKPLGMEYDATWSLDKKDGLEKTFCCLNARARDFSKIGRLYLNKGNWNGTQIVSQKWVEESTKADVSDGGAGYYKYQWWLSEPDGAFTAKGILGQFIYVNPEKNLIIVRLGKNYGNVNWDSMFAYLSENY
jgi:CubicO group peptidase (beta-lactamase class C family)